MGLKTRLSSYCIKPANNGVNLVTSRKINTRLVRFIDSDKKSSGMSDFLSAIKNCLQPKLVCVSWALEKLF